MCFDSHAPYVHPANLVDQDLALSLTDILAWVAKTCRTDTAVFKVKVAQGARYLHCSAAGHTLLELLSTCFFLIRFQSPELRFDPRIELLLGALELRAQHLVQSHNFQAVLQQDPDMWCDVLNACVTQVRHDARSRLFLLALRRHEEAIHKRFLDLKTYFKQVDAALPGSQVLRLDLEYRESAFHNSDGLENRYLRLQQDSRDWLAFVRQTLGSALVGEAWKFDFGSGHTYCMHAALVLNGPGRNEVTDIVSSLEDQWRHVTVNKGYSVDCNAAPYPFEYRGMHPDGVFRSTVAERLHNCAVYMAHTDSILRVELPGKATPFGIGVAPTDAKKMGKGTGRVPQTTHVVRDTVHPLYACMPSAEPAAGSALR